MNEVCEISERAHRHHIPFHVHFYVQIRTRFIGRFSKIRLFVCSLFASFCSRRYYNRFSLCFFWTNKFNLQCDSWFFLCCWLSGELMKVCSSSIFNDVCIRCLQSFGETLLRSSKKFALQAPAYTIDVLLIDIGDQSKNASKRALLHSNAVFVHFEGDDNKTLGTNRTKHWTKKFDEGQNMIENCIARKYSVLMFISRILIWFAKNRTK